MNTDKMLEQFTSTEEIKIFCQSQFKQIQQLSKENKELKEKLSVMSKEVRTIVKREMSSPSDGLKVLDDAKTISQIQLNVLKDLSFERELTTDEAKRVEIYNRIITGTQDKKDKPLKADIEILKEADLLKLATNE